MQRLSDKLVYSPQDLIQFVNSKYACWMDRLALEHPESVPVCSNTDNMLNVLIQLGQEHEQRYLRQLQNSGQDLCTIENRRAFEATLVAMQAGRSYIYQAALHQGAFLGYADFLVRVESPSILGSWSYAPLECKLALSPKPDFILQSTCYCDLLQQFQGQLPQQFFLLLGTGETKAYPTEQYIYYYRHLHQTFLDFMGEFCPQTPPLLSVGNHGRWQDHADKQLVELDHLSLVANINRSQINRLESAGIVTVQELAEADPDQRIPKLDPQIFQRLVQQARLQRLTNTQDQIAYEVLFSDPEVPRRGLALLPPANPMDVYFDMEGYPLADGGLEYLFGATCAENNALVFRDWWAHDAGMEKQAFEDFLDWVCDRWRQDPGMHIYHYAPYEPVALKRLMGKYATRETQLDNLLRAGVFIDLYQIVRQGLRVGVPSYSIKFLEPLYDCQRTGEVKNAEASVIQYFQWTQERDSDLPEASPLLREIRDYNQVDCESTKALADWLRQLQHQHDISYQPKPGQEEVLQQSKSETEISEATLLAAEILAGDSASVQAPIQFLFAHLLEFHRREAKPFWWQRFAWLQMEESDLHDELDCLAGLERTLKPPYRRTARSRSWSYEYQFNPDQETKLVSGTECWFVPESALRACKLEELDQNQGLAVVSVSDKKLAQVRQDYPNWEPCQRISLIHANFVRTEQLAQGILETVQDWQQTKTLQPALKDFLERRPPRICNHQDPMVIPQGVDLLQGAIHAVANLDNSTLCIQGPPGSGKTYAAAQIILHLLQQGQTVAIAANSHKVIANLLGRVARLATDHQITFQGAKIGGPSDDPVFQHSAIALKPKVTEVLPPQYQLVGATSFQLCRPEAIGQWDYLFVDEAGQISLANLVAMVRCARNLVLIGDQMQLEQPIQGSHPGESGCSALGYLLNGQATIPPELGIFLDTSYRMHPDICSFISQSIYEGRLRHHPQTVHHQLSLEDRCELSIPQGNGILYVPVNHEGNTQCSEEEIEVIEQLVTELIGLPYVSERGQRQGSLEAEDILIVAPYNQQVRKLEARLGEQARLGTVDKFQGQEAPVLIVSMCSSSSELIPRGLEFLLNRNRLNVAVSRAQCLSIVVGSPALAATSCETVSEIELINLYCKVMLRNPIG